MITFKRFTASERMSQETLAFAADVYWQGRKIGHGSNSGRGEQAMFHRSQSATADDLRDATVFARQQQLDIGDAGSPRMVTADSLDEYLDWLACDVNAVRRERTWLRRQLKGSVLFYAGDELKAIRRPWDPALRGHVELTHAGAKVLNAMSFEEAFGLHAAKRSLRIPSGE